MNKSVLEQTKIDKQVEQKEIEKEMLQKQLDSDLQKRQMEFDQELKLASLKAKSEAGEDVVPRSPFSGVGGPHIKLPVFDAEKDNFDAFIT